MNGIINVLKPPMMTSNSVISALKKITGQSHIGHTGTLDPNASGVLPICIGKATKLAEYFLADEKEYIGEILFGFETDSCDTEGTVTATSSIIPSAEEFISALAEFRGTIEQIPPVFSAIKINGKKAYELARENVSVELKPRQITINELELISHPAPDRFIIRVACSKGTYIRSLARDIARFLGTHACLSMLIRTCSGIFNIADAVTLEEVKSAFESGNEAGVLLDPSNVLSHLPAVDFSYEYEKKLLCGNSQPLSFAEKHDTFNECSVIRILCCGKLIALGKLLRDSNGKEIIQPTKVIAE